MKQCYAFPFFLQTFLAHFRSLNFDFWADIWEQELFVFMQAYLHKDSNLSGLYLWVYFSSCKNTEFVWG